MDSSGVIWRLLLGSLTAASSKLAFWTILHQNGAVSLLYLNLFHLPGVWGGAPLPYAAVCLLKGSCGLMPAAPHLYPFLSGKTQSYNRKLWKFIHIKVLATIIVLGGTGVALCSKWGQGLKLNRSTCIQSN